MKALGDRLYEDSAGSRGVGGRQLTRRKDPMVADVGTPFVCIAPRTLQCEKRFIFR